MAKSVMVFDGKRDLEIDLENGTVIRALPRWNKQGCVNRVHINVDKYRVPKDYKPQETAPRNTSYIRPENILVKC